MSRPSVLLGASRTIVAWASWNEFCNGPHTRVEFLAGLVHEGESQPFVLGGLAFVVGRPGCPPSLAIPLHQDAFTLGPVPADGLPVPILGPDPLDAIYCYPSDPVALAKWLRPCQAIDALQPGLNSNDLDALMDMVEPEDFTCPAPGFDQFPPSLCEGASAGEVRLGVAFARLGSMPSLMSADEVRSLFEGVIEGAKEGSLYRTRIATVACEDDACKRFIVGIASDGSVPAAYLRLEVDDGALRITEVGFAGEKAHALVLRRGGELPADAGVTPDVFVPIVGPY